MTPEEVAQAQLVAYNNRDIDTFASCHAPDVELYTFPEVEPFAIGRDRLREIYGDVFENSPNLHAEVTHRIVLGNTVIDHELVTGRKGIDHLEIIAIYTIKDGQISKAHFVRN